MNSRERVLMALDHREPDKMPIDLGSPVSGIAVISYNKLKGKLGVETKTEVIDKMQQLAKVDEEILRKFKVDTRHVWAESKTLKRGNNPYTDEWGVKRAMPKGGYYYDMVWNPLAEADISKIKKYKGPPTEELGITKELEKKAKYLYENTDYALITTFPGIFEKAWELRGVERLLMDVALDKKLTVVLFDKVLEIELEIYEKLLAYVGKYIQLIMFTEDLGREDGLLFSPKFYREVLKRCQKKLIQAIKKHTQAKIAMHSDGAIRPLLKDFVEVGVDVINPVQARAKDMDTKRLKKDFGKDLCFWGAIDTQKILPFGTPHEVKEEVKRRIEDLAPGGGYLLASCHNIQADVPPENIEAMFEAARDYGKY